MYLYSDASTMHRENKRLLLSPLSLPPHILALFSVSRPLIMYSAFQWALCSLSWYMVLKIHTSYKVLTQSNEAGGQLHLFSKIDFSLDSVESSVCLDPKPVYHVQPVISTNPTQHGWLFLCLALELLPSCSILQETLMQRLWMLKKYEGNGLQRAAWLTCFYYSAAEC